MSVTERSVGNWLDWSLPASRRFGMTEWMDEPGADQALIDDSLRFLTRLNERMGWGVATLDALAAMLQGVEAPQIVDVGTGAGDLPREIVADGRFAGAQVVGVDLHQRTAAYARRHSGGKYQVLRADALALPLADRSVDVCVCGLFLHHLPDEMVVRALAEMRRVSRVGVVAGDLLRSLRGLLGIRLLGLMSNRMVRHDGEVSVRQAFTTGELRELFGRAGLPVTELRTLGGVRVVVSAAV